MNPTTRRPRTSRFCTLVTWVMGVVVTGGAGFASPPTDPIPVPLFSFDATSPSIGTNGLFSDVVFRKGGPTDSFPVPVIPGANIGLGSPEDDIDGLSFNRASAFPPTATFVLMFSVDRRTTGNTPPAPVLVGADAPFNVADQAMRGHAAGDAFVSLNLFNRSGIIVQPFRTGVAASNTQVLNNYDEGGHDFEAQPATSSRDIVTDPEDNVSAMATEDVSTGGLRGVRVVPGLYFTATTNSASLDTPGRLPGSSGADIFYDPAPENPQSVIQMYVSAQQLGLDSPPPFLNDIGGIVVLDDNIEGTFEQGDLVLFSLAPGSPALQSIPGMSSNGAADILAGFVGTDGLVHVNVFAAAKELGLTGPNDSIDALEIVSCPSDPTTCAQLSGIQLIRGDWDNNATVDDVDVPFYVGCLSGPKEGMYFSLPPQLCRDVFDFDQDSDVDLFDFGRFQEVFGL